MHRDIYFVTSEGLLTPFLAIYLRLFKLIMDSRKSQACSLSHQVIEQNRLSMGLRELCSQSPCGQAQLFFQEGLQRDIPLKMTKVQLINIKPPSTLLMLICCTFGFHHGFNDWLLLIAPRRGGGGGKGPPFPLEALYLIACVVQDLTRGVSP